MKIKILRDIRPLLSNGRHTLKEGDIIELLENDAKRLIGLGAAEKVKAEKKKKIIEPEAKE